MKTKTCSTCDKVKSLDQFNKKSAATDGLQNYCRDCNSEKVKKHYTQNKLERKQQIVLRKKAIYKWFLEYRADKACLYCGENESCCLEFHHRDPAEKDFEISNMANWGMSIERILKEMTKCDVVCSNCHNKIHAGVIDCGGEERFPLKPLKLLKQDRYLTPQLIDSSMGEG